MQREDLQNLITVSIDISELEAKLDFLKHVREHVIDRFKKEHAPGILTADCALDDIEEELKVKLVYVNAVLRGEVKIDDAYGLDEEDEDDD